MKPDADRSVELLAANSMEESARIPSSIQFANNTRYLATPHVTSVHRSPDLKYLAKGCIDGSVAVYNYPTHAPGMSMIKVLDARFVILTGAALGSWPWFKHC